MWNPRYVIYGWNKENCPDHLDTQFVWGCDKFSEAVEACEETFENIFEVLVIRDTLTGVTVQH